VAFNFLNQFNRFVVLPKPHKISQIVMDSGRIFEGLIANGLEKRIRFAVPLQLV